MESIKTPCERIKRGIAHITAYGLLKGKFRSRHWDEGLLSGKMVTDFDGPACLIGSMLTNEEVAWHVYRSALEITKLPGMAGALDALGFDDMIKAWHWNDEEERTKEDVLARLETGKAAVCPN